MPDKYKRLRDMTRKQIITRLNRKYKDCAGVPPSTVKAIADRIIEKRKAERDTQRRNAIHKDKWELIIAPLAREIRSIQTRLTQWRRREQTDMLTFFTPYLTALLKVRDILRTYQRQSLDPNAKAKAVNLSDEGILPNSLARLPLGQHWSDWIPHKVKREFMQTHAQLSAVVRTRKLSPIFQRDPSKTIIDQHYRVRQAWQEELNQLENIVERDGIDRRPLEAQQADKIRLAIAKLEAAPSHRRITPYWRKLIGNHKEEV